MKRPTQIRAILYKAYFESLHDYDPKPDPKRVTFCWVLANNAEEAIAKTKAAFPRETINSLHCERTTAYGKTLPDIILL